MLLEGRSWNICHLAHRLLHLHLQLLLLVAGHKMQLEKWPIKVEQGFLQEFPTNLSQISFTFSVTPSMENFDGGSKQTAASGTARTALSFSPHWKISMFLLKLDVFFGSKKLISEKVNIVTFQSSSVMAPTRMSRWVVSVGLRIAALANKYNSAKLPWTLSWRVGTCRF